MLLLLLLLLVTAAWCVGRRRFDDAVVYCFLFFNINVEEHVVPTEPLTAK